ncbi:hypothetical protein H0H93_006269 [Arthromyces matolae]|nr:hypothetical protein H0H93_006269 [Arthromyces matolae]
MSSTTMAVDAPNPPKLVLDDFIATALSATPPALHTYFESFRNLHTRKLWHQLTQKLKAFFDDELSRPYRVDVFERFVRDFEGKINQLRLVEMGVKVSRDIDNPQTHLAFLTALLSRIDNEKSQEAHVLLLASIAHVKLIYGDVDGTKMDMDAAWKILDTLEGVENGVNAAYYGVAADYYKARAEYAPYYRNSLLYLACVDLDTDMTPEERLSRSHDLGISALLADTIYNFGELRSANNRTMSFQTIAEATRQPIEEVEAMVMKALSLKLIRGSIDEVDQKVQISWVQPRVLSREQIGSLAQRLGEWVSKLNTVEQRIAPEVLGSS